jgi:hypothetical protein
LQVRVLPGAPIRHNYCAECTLVGVAQLVEPRIVIPVVVGSSPIIHPISRFRTREENSNGPLAQLGRAVDS